MNNAGLEFQDLTRLVMPQSIVLVGASDKPNSIGARTLENLTTYSDWGGQLTLVHPTRREIAGRACHASVRDLDQAPDVAIVAVPADAAVETLRDCGARGVRFAIVFTSGFGEMGEAGHAAEAQMREIVARTGMRIYGPNCPGLNNINGKLGMSFSPAYRFDRMPGPIGVATQGGGLGRAFMQSAMARGVGTGLWCSGGNEVDLEVSDYIHCMADAPDIRVIYTVLEGVRNGPRFMAAAMHAARRGKPIVAIKVGKSDYGVKAAASHTAAITGSAEINAAVYRELGIVEVDDIDEAVDAATLLARGQPTGREKIAVYCFSGGTGALTSDRIGVAGLTMSELAPATVAELKRWLPPYVPVGNPVDVTAEVLVRSDITSGTLKATADDPNTDLVVLPIPVDYGQATTLMAQSAVEVQAGVQTPIVPIWISDRIGEGHGIMVQGGLAPMRSVRNAVTAIRRFTEHGRWRSTLDPAWRPLGAARAAQETTTFTEAAAKRVLQQAGVGTPQGIVARTAEDAAHAWRRLGAGKVAMKVVSSRITHKTDVGGVRLGIASEAEARAAFDGICARVCDAHHPSVIEGVLVEAMLDEPFVEAVVGIHRDAVFGHVCTFGLGGVGVELFKDVSRRLLPLTPASARAMVQETRCHALLAGHRGQAGYDIDALVQALVRLSDFVAKNAGVVEELEINPLAVRPRGQGVAALDAVLTCNAKETLTW
ncbi:acetate--CoA ligase family protein [Pseudorhodoferax sp.]|uniref:acetate--CoA ligase family protein n=1 Tax=Pseudorhodoferax sp. TaxID=1993553 RepID=UPI002DD675CA|nr:acetate--CoA ligase family protein [Pseudorhodoferax sp.]